MSVNRANYIKSVKSLYIAEYNNQRDKWCDAAKLAKKYLSSFIFA